MRQKKKRPLSPLHRRVHINGKEWTYKIFGIDENTVIAIVNPELTLKHYIHASYISDDFGKRYFVEEGDNEGCYSMHPCLTPANIKEYITKELLNKKENVKMREPKKDFEHGIIVD